MARRTEHGVSQYPDWKCRSCGKEYPFDYEHSKCKALKGDGICLGPLHRYIRYEVKQPGIKYEGIPPNRKEGQWKA